MMASAMGADLPQERRMLLLLDVQDDVAVRPSHLAMPVRAAQRWDAQERLRHVAAVSGAPLRCDADLIAIGRACLDRHTQVALLCVCAVAEARRTCRGAARA